MNKLRFTWMSFASFVNMWLTRFADMRLTRFVDVWLTRFAEMLLTRAEVRFRVPLFAYIIVLLSVCSLPQAALAETTCMTNELLMVPEPCQPRRTHVKPRQTRTVTRRILSNHKSAARLVGNAATSAGPSGVANSAITAGPSGVANSAITSGLKVAVHAN